jgi:hypothetical protein
MLNRALKEWISMSWRSNISLHNHNEDLVERDDVEMKTI